MNYLSQQAIGRYVVDDAELDVPAVWKRLTAMFTDGERCWLRSFPSLVPQQTGPVRPGSEFEVTGSAGGRYPIIVTEWSSKDARFAFREGPSKNPPTSEPSPYCGATYTFRIVQEDDVVVIDGAYANQYRDIKAGAETTDPVKALEWVLSGIRQIPLLGKIIFVHAA